MKGRTIPYSDEEMAWLFPRRERPRRHLHAAFVARFGRDDVSADNLKAMLQRKGWKTGRTGCFAPGQAPANKGKEMPYNPNSAATRFKKGGLPHNHRGPGHERIDSKDGYIVMIVGETNPHTGAKTRPVHKHRYLWEKANGPVPQAHVLKCLDGDKTNCDLSNWELMPRAMLPGLNGRFGRGYDAAPSELKPTIMAISKLEHSARERKKADR